MMDITLEWMFATGFGVVYGGGTPSNGGFGLLRKDVGDRTVFVHYGSKPCKTTFWYRTVDRHNGGEMQLNSQDDVLNMLA